MRAQWSAWASVRVPLPGEPEAEHGRCCDGRLTTPLIRKEGASFALGLCDAEQR